MIQGYIYPSLDSSVRDKHDNTNCNSVEYCISTNFVSTCTLLPYNRIINDFSVVATCRAVTQSYWHMRLNFCQGIHLVLIIIDHSRIPK